MPTPALTLKNLNKTYNNGFKALNNINLEVEQGDFMALLGANGAGKSTTIGIISNLVNKNSGSVNILSYDLDQNPAEAKRQLGIVPQDFNFIAFETPLQIVMNQAAFFGIPRKIAYPRAKKYLSLVDLWEKRDQAAAKLSGGMKRRLMIARALMHQPKLLILDEPTAGVDIEIRQSMWDFLRQLNQEGITIILTTHYLEEAETLCNKIAIMREGNIVLNTTMQDLLSRQSNETFVLYLDQPTETLIETQNLHQVDPNTLEVDLDKNQPITEALASLQQQGIIVNRLRNKANRLETLFLETVHA